MNDKKERKDNEQSAVEKRSPFPLIRLGKIILLCSLDATKTQKPVIIEGCVGCEYNYLQAFKSTHLPLRQVTVH